MPVAAYVMSETQLYLRPLQPGLARVYMVPAPIASMTRTPTGDIAIAQTVNFDASGSVGDITFYEFDDAGQDPVNNPAARGQYPMSVQDGGPYASHAYYNPGTKNPRVWVEGAGRTDSFFLTFEVTEYGSNPEPETVELPTRYLGGYVENYQSTIYPHDVPNANWIKLAFYSSDSNRQLALGSGNNMNVNTLRDSVATCKAAGVGVSMSLGGAGQGYPPVNQTQADSMASQLIAICEDVGFSGVDCNWEQFSYDEGFTTGNAQYTASMMRQVKDHFAAKGDPFTLSLATYGSQGSGGTPNDVGLAHIEVAKHLKGSPGDVLGFVGFQYYNIGAGSGWEVDWNWVSNVYDEWVSRIPGLTPSQWSLGFLNVHDVQPTPDTSYQRMADLINQFRSTYGTVRGAWTWGVEEKQHPTYPFFNNPVLSAIDPE